jgi:uncharacterized protein (DUF2062 family)
MVFKRRDKPPILARARELMLPRRGWRRGIEYLGHRVRRLPDTPHRIALGIACGVFVTFTPFFGLHFFLAALLAWGLRGNILASLIGTGFGNPITFPIIAPAALTLGRRMLGYGEGGHDPARVLEAFNGFFVGLWQSLLSLFGRGEAEWDKLNVFLVDVIWPYCVGGVLPGLATAAASYYLARPLIAAYQARRRARMHARAHARLAEQKPAHDPGTRDRSERR